MGLLDQFKAYIQANTPRATTPRVSPGKVINEGLLNPNQFNAPAANRFKDSLFGMTGIVPGVGDVASGVQAADFWNRGEKLNAGLSALGALPLIPAIGGQIVYHGSPNVFNKFDLSKAGSTTDEGALGKAIYTSTDKTVADSWPNVYKIDEQSKNPLKLSMADFSTDKKKLVREALGLPFDANAEMVTKAARDKGFDSVMLDYSPTGYKHQEIALFDDQLPRILEINGQPTGLLSYADEAKKAVTKNVSIDSLKLNEGGAGIAKAKWAWEPNYVHKNNAPVRVDRATNEVLDGYHRIEQARRNGQNNIDIVYVDLSAEARKALGLPDVPTKK